MRKKDREAFCAAFAAPKPLRKKSFLRKIRQPAISRTEFMLRQAGYVRKWAWAISGLVFGIAFVDVFSIQREVLWTAGALMPFAALAVVTEGARSEAHGMAELEQATRFSIQSVLLVRMGMVGCLHLLLCLLVSALGKNDIAAAFRTGIYLLVPYLLTCVAGFEILRRIRGREGMYGCLGSAVLVSAVYFIFGHRSAFFFAEPYFGGWAAAFAVLLAAGCREVKLSLFQREEDFVWS